MPEFHPKAVLETRAKIVYAVQRTGRNTDIYTMDAGGANVTRLTDNGDSDDSSPKWSPDGSKIAFVSTRDGNPEIYVMNSDGRKQTRLTNDLASDSHPSWIIYGTKIVFESDRGGNDTELYILNTSLLQVEQQLTWNSYLDTEPDFVAIPNDAENVGDDVPPVVVLTPDREPDKNGYYNSKVTIQVKGNDTSTGNSGVKSYNPSEIIHVFPNGKNIQLSASCTDYSENTGAANITISYDDTLPEVSVTYPVNDATLDASSFPLTIYGSVKDEISGIDRVEVSIDSKSFRMARLSSNSSSEWSFVVEELSPNVTHKIKARATDNAGNTRTSEEITIAARVNDVGQQVLSISPPRPILLNSTIPNQITAGQDVIIATNITHSLADRDQKFIAIIEVRNTENSGITEYLILHPAEIKANTQIEIGVLWIPLHAGTYELRVFAISNFSSLVILSSIQSSKVAVAEAVGSLS
jgi:hypothetical protein